MTLEEADALYDRTFRGNGHKDAIIAAQICAAYNEHKKVTWGCFNGYYVSNGRVSRVLRTVEDIKKMCLA